MKPHPPATTPDRSPAALPATCAVAGLAVRAAVRSRLFLSLMVLLLAVVIGVPLAVKGDGTAAGQVRILLLYALGMGSMVLGAATVWAGCGMISQEIEERQIRLLAVKPVHPFRIWLGKWLGLLALDAVLLGAAGAVVYGLLQWRLGAAQISPEERRQIGEEILTGRRLFSPRPDPIAAQVDAELARLIRAHGLPAGISREEARATLERALRTRRAAVAPGRTREWIFDVPSPAGETTPVLLRFRLSPDAAGRRPVSGTWTAGPVGEPERFRHAVEGVLTGAVQFRIPPELLGTGEPVVVRFHNEPRPRSRTVVFRAGHEAELLVREASFAANLVLALVIVFCQLALLAAIGITAGAAFSFPVAAFTAAALLLISLLSHSFIGGSSPEAAARVHAHHHGPAPEPSALVQTAEKGIRCTAAITEPAMQFAPLGRLADGILVAPARAARAAVLLLFLYPAPLALIATLCLRRRELGAT